MPTQLPDALKRQLSSPQDSAETMKVYCDWLHEQSDPGATAVQTGNWREVIAREFGAPAALQVQLDPNPLPSRLEVHGADLPTDLLSRLTRWPSVHSVRSIEVRDSGALDLESLASLQSVKFLRLDRGPHQRLSGWAGVTSGELHDLRLSLKSGLAADEVEALLNWRCPRLRWLVLNLGAHEHSGFLSELVPQWFDRLLAFCVTATRASQVTALLQGQAFRGVKSGVLRLVLPVAEALALRESFFRAHPHALLSAHPDPNLGYRDVAGTDRTGLTVDFSPSWTWGTRSGETPDHMPENLFRYCQACALPDARVEWVGLAHGGAHEVELYCQHCEYFSAYRRESRPAPSCL